MRNGIWSLQNGLACYDKPFKETRRWNRESLLIAVKNVKKNRDWYTTEEAYLTDLSFFLEGLYLLTEEEI